MRIEKIESKQLIENVIDDKIKTYFMFVRIYIDKQFDMQKTHVQRRIQINLTLIEKKIRYQNYIARNFARIRKIK